MITSRGGGDRGGQAHDWQTGEPPEGQRPSVHRRSNVHEADCRGGGTLISFLYPGKKRTSSKSWPGRKATADRGDRFAHPRGAQKMERCREAKIAGYARWSKRPAIGRFFGTDDAGGRVRREDRSSARAWRGGGDFGRGERHGSVCARSTRGDGQEQVRAGPSSSSQRVEEATGGAAMEGDSPAL